MLWLILIIITAITFYFVFIKPVNYWKRNGVAQLSTYQVWKQNLLEFLMTEPIPETFQTTYDAFPGFRYCGSYQITNKLLVIRDPELIKQITVKDFDHFVDHIQFTPENAEPLWEKNLVSLKGDKWKNMRSVLSPSFTSSKMKMMFNLMVDCCNLYVTHFENLTNGGIVAVEEMRDVFSRFANDVIASTAFGFTCNSVKDRNNEFFMMGTKLVRMEGFWLNIKFSLMFMFPSLAKLLKLRFLPKKPSLFFTNVIEEAIRMRKEKGIIRQNMLALLMEASKQKSDSTEKNINDFTVQDITAQALIFFFAGFDSISTQMCFMAYELAVNPEIQQKLQAEVDKTVEECNGNITYDSLSKMKYMDMVVSETLRKWPSAVILDRICTKPYTIEPINNKEMPVFIKKGDMLMVPLFGLHRDPVYFPNPDRFDPERFCEENKSFLTSSFLPFGSGPRTCIANRFALMETKVLFFHFLQKFNFIVVNKTQVPLKLAKRTFQLVAEGGIWLGLKKRSS